MIALASAKAIMALALLPFMAAGPTSGRVELVLTGLRNPKGIVRVCLTRSADYFPDCKRDPEAVSRSVPAAHASRLSFSVVAPGTYALAVFHDENGNAKLDTFAKIPREGFGFSRNPKIRFGAPSFKHVAFPVTEAPVRVTVRMQYFL